MLTTAIRVCYYLFCFPRHLSLRHHPFPFVPFPSPLSSLIPPSVYFFIYLYYRCGNIANLSRRNPLRMVDISAGERRRRIWRVLDRSVFSFSPLPLPYEAVEWRPKTVGRYGFRSPTRQPSLGTLFLFLSPSPSLLISRRLVSLWKSSRFRCMDSA